MEEALALSVTDLGIDGLEDIEQIGTGGSSRVYRARQIDLDRVVALKVLNAGEDQDVVRRFDRERKAMGRLSLHEGIVPVYSSGLTHHGEPYLVMPYYPSGSLQDQIDTGAMDWETAVHYVDVAAETIAAAHDEGIVHLDLKPANILLTVNGAPRIADFGIARLLTGSTAARTNGNAAFTPAYSAPETFLDGETGPASDVYGLGATLWALLVGHPPFLTPGNDTNLMSVIGRVVNNPVGDLRHFTPAPICEVVERAMAKQPQLRYQTAREFSDALKAAAAMSAGEATTAALPAMGPPPGEATVVDAAPPVNMLFPDREPGYDDAGVTGVLAATPSPELPPSLASTIPPGDAPARPLLQETAQPLPAPMGPITPQPPTRGPFIEFERFRLGPILLGLIAFLAVAIAAMMVLTGDNTDGGNTVITNPAAPSTDTSLSTSEPGASESSVTAASDSSTTDVSSSTPTSSSPATTGSSSPTSVSSSSDTTSTTASTTETTTSTTSSTTNSTTSTSETTTSTSSSTTSSTTSTTVPLAIQPPTGLTATPTSDSVSLIWTAPSEGPTPIGYVVVRDGTPIETVSATGYTDDNVVAGATYVYQVRSVGEGAGETSALSGSETVSIPDPLTVSATEGRLRRTVIQVLITSNQPVTYEVSAVPSAGGTATRISGPATGRHAVSHEPTVSGLDPDTSYDLTVTVINESGIRATTTLDGVSTLP